MVCHLKESFLTPTIFKMISSRLVIRITQLSIINGNSLQKEIIHSIRFNILSANLIDVDRKINTKHNQQNTDMTLTNCILDQMINIPGTLLLFMLGEKKKKKSSWITNM